MTAVASSPRTGRVAEVMKPFLTLQVGMGALMLLLLYSPTVWGLAHGLWQLDSHSHGPVVFAVSVWLFIRGFSAHDREGGLTQPKRISGGLIFGIGLLMYVLGRSQSVDVLEVGSAIPVVLGAVLLTRGSALARRLWFAFVFLLFLVPLPGSLVDVITQPMKLGVSWAVESLLYALGYPIGRSGVVLGIGPYQLFVADACAGLNSLFMLEAFGLLYLNVVRHESALRNAALAVLIVPISFVSNVIRVAILALVTYHFGDEAGQGFIHGSSGMLLFVVALLLTVAVDVGMRALMSVQRSPLAVQHLETRAGTRHPPESVTASLMGLLLSPSKMQPVCAMLTAASIATIFTWAMTPPPLAPAADVDLSAVIPIQFGDWKYVDLPALTVDVVPRNTVNKETDRPYDGVVMRAYANSNGQTVALALAYAADQRQEVKIHRPELCYTAQGFRVIDNNSVRLLLEPNTFSGEAVTGLVPGNRLYVESKRSTQVVSYVIRIGSTYPQSSWALRNALFQNSLFGRQNDGLLLRASSLVPQAKQITAESYALNEEFLTDLIAAMPRDGRKLLFGPIAALPNRSALQSAEIQR